MPNAQCTRHKDEGHLYQVAGADLVGKVRKGVLVDYAISQIDSLSMKHLLGLVRSPA